MSRPKLSAMSPAKKVIASKVLCDEGFTYSQIGRILGISDDTAKRYIEKYSPIEDSVRLSKFEAGFKTLVAGKSFEGQMAVYNRLLELVPKERRVSEVVKAGEFFQGKSNDGVKVQVNNFVPLLGGESKNALPENNSNTEDITTS